MSQLKIEWKNADPDERIAKEVTGETDALDLRIHRNSPRHGWPWEIRDKRKGFTILRSAPDGAVPSIEAARDKVRSRISRLGDPTRSDIVGLARFARKVDRRLTKFFVGREPEMRRIRNMVEEVAAMKDEGAAKPAAGSTMLISGVPGGRQDGAAGQDEEGLEHVGAEIHEPLAVEIPLGVLGNRNAFVNSVLTQLPGKAGWGLLDRLSKVGFGLDVELAKKERSEMQDMPTVFRQPTVPVLAGLANSKTALEAAGISRLDARSMLAPGALDKDEVFESVMLFMDAFHLEGNRDFWAGHVFKWSEGWPMHLHNGLSALAEMLVSDAVDGELDRADIAAVRREAYARRATYYNDRTSGPAGSFLLLLARVMNDLPEGGILRDDCEEKISEAAAKGRKGGVLPEGMSPSGLFDEMLRKGLIQSKGGNSKRFVCPIPSMRSWCVAKSGRLLPTAALEGDSSDMAADVREGLDPNGTDVLGRTPLHWAAMEDWPEAVRTLPKLGSDPGLPDGEGKTPLVLAPEGSQTALIVVAAPRKSDLSAVPGRIRVRRDTEGVPGFDLQRVPEKGSGREGMPGDRARSAWQFGQKGFSVRAERRDLAVLKGGTVVVGEDLGTWSYAIRDSSDTLAAPVAHGSGFATAEIACKAAIEALDRVMA